MSPLSSVVVCVLLAGELTASLLASLRPGGRMAILDFAPTGGKESATRTISGRRFTVVAQRT